MTLTIICGNMGTGKTLFCTILAYYNNSNYDVISNYHIKFPHKKSYDFDINKFITAQYENAIILLDEAYSYLESRISGSDLNRLLSYILFQSRKKNVDMYLTAQLISTLDLRFRNLCDFYITASRTLTGFSYNILDVFKQQLVQIQLNKEKCLPFFSMYDTNEIILPNLKALEHKMLNGQQKIEKACEIAHDIIDSYIDEKITLDIVQTYCMQYEIPKFFEKMIWVHVKLIKKEEKKNEDNEK